MAPSTWRFPLASLSATPWTPTKNLAETLPTTLKRTPTEAKALEADKRFRELLKEPTVAEIMIRIGFLGLLVVISANDSPKPKSHY